MKETQAIIDGMKDITRRLDDMNPLTKDQWKQYQKVKMFRHLHRQGRLRHQGRLLELGQLPSMIEDNARKPNSTARNGVTTT